MKKSYTKETARSAVEGLLAEIKAKKSDFDCPDDFISEHCWSLKYLSGGFSEANDLFRRVHSNPNGASVIEVAITEKVKKFREERGMKPQVKLQIVVDKVSYNGQSYIFTFEEQDDGTYICLNG